MTRPRRAAGEKPLHWVGSSRKDLLGFPEQVMSRIGFALAHEDYEVRYGGEEDRS